MLREEKTQLEQSIEAKLFGKIKSKLTKPLVEDIEIPIISPAVLPSVDIVTISPQPIVPISAPNPNVDIINILTAQSEMMKNILDAMAMKKHQLRGNFKIYKTKCLWVV